MKNIKKIKLEHVKSMHTIVASLNNEEAYMTWINCMPDEPTEEDFQSFTEEENQELFDELTNLFVNIIKKYIGDGMFICDKLYSGD